MPEEDRKNPNMAYNMDPTSASAYLLKQMDSTYGHESREMFPSKDYFRSKDVDVEPSQAQTGVANEPIKRKPVNYSNLSKEEAIEVFHGLLSDLGVGATWKWEDVNRVT